MPRLSKLRMMDPLLSRLSTSLRSKPSRTSSRWTHSTSAVPLQRSPTEKRSIWGVDSRKLGSTWRWLTTQVAASRSHCGVRCVKETRTCRLVTSWQSKVLAYQSSVARVWTLPMTTPSYSSIWTTNVARASRLGTPSWWQVVRVIHSKPSGAWPWRLRKVREMAIVQQIWTRKASTMVATKSEVKTEKKARETATWTWSVRLVRAWMMRMTLTSITSSSSMATSHVSRTTIESSTQHACRRIAAAKWQRIPPASNVSTVASNSWPTYRPTWLQQRSLTSQSPSTSTSQGSMGPP